MLGSDEEVSMLRLAELVRELTGTKSDIVLVPYTEAYAEGFEDMQRRVPDVSKLERMIGFRPRTPLEDIVRDVIVYERSRLAAT